MTAKTHQDIVVKAATLSNGRYGKIVLGEKYWIENQVAGALNDRILRDWFYPCLPRAIPCIHRLTKEILNTGKEDHSKIAFLISWVSHYISDSLWINHVYQRETFDRISKKDQDFDNNIEREIQSDKYRKIILTSNITPWDKGFWSAFWKVSIKADRMKNDYRNCWERGGDYLDIAIKNIIDCIKVFENYLRYLDFAARDGTGNRGKVIKNPKRILCRNDELKENVYSLAMDIMLNNSCSLSDVFVDDESAADIIVRQANETSIAFEDHKLIITGEVKTIGEIIDHYIFGAQVNFGTENYASELKYWPGNYVLDSAWTGKQLESLLFTPEFSQKLTDISGHKGVDALLRPANISDEAKKDRENWIELRQKWLSKWKVVLGKEKE